MSRQAEVWLSRVALWLPALLFLALNAGLFSFHRGVLASRVTAFESRRAQAEEQSARLESEEATLAARLAAIEANRAQRETLYRDWFSTPDLRLTSAIAEVKQLATRSGLQIRAIAYPQERIADYGLARRSFRFSVEGSYPALRQLVYLIEMTPSFLVLDRIQVGEVRAGGDLRAELELSTLFVDAVAPAAAGERSSS